MAIKLKEAVDLNWLKEKTGMCSRGIFLKIDSVAPLSEIVPNCLTFSREKFISKYPIAIIGPDEMDSKKVGLIPSINPRLDFVRALRALEEHIGFEKDQADPIIDCTCQIGKNVSIGLGVEIGEGTVIYDNVVIAEGVKIGKNCLIKSGAVIGEEGFGFERDEEGTPLRMPHLCSVIIGDNVEIGSLTTVSRGVLGHTKIDRHTKVDDRCQIAHNCHIKEKVLIASGAEVAGSVVIGEKSWISTGATIKNNLTIGEEGFVGLGAVVIRDVKKGEKVFGNPARGLF